MVRVELQTQYISPSLVLRVYYNYAPTLLQPFVRFLALHILPLDHPVGHCMELGGGGGIFTPIPKFYFINYVPTILK